MLAAVSGPVRFCKQVWQAVRHQGYLDSEVDGYAGCETGPSAVQTIVQQPAVMLEGTVNVGALSSSDMGATRTSVLALEPEAGVAAKIDAFAGLEADGLGLSAL